MNVDKIATVTNYCPRAPISPYPPREILASKNIFTCYAEKSTGFLSEKEAEAQKSIFTNKKKKK